MADKEKIDARKECNMNNVKKEREIERGKRKKKWKRKLLYEKGFL